MLGRRKRTRLIAININSIVFPYCQNIAEIPCPSPLVLYTRTKSLRVRKAPRRYQEEEVPNVPTPHELPRARGQSAQSCQRAQDMARTLPQRWKVLHQQQWQEYSRQPARRRGP